ncbi:MAG: sigma 54-interacting transcriptional regulator, partial [Actinobacteria bacterium]|nr:sigma 54-interacting transcriptional regulator [Actinomycetota bacterium]
FLDEIGEMDPLLQAKLLHVLQDNRVHPVGALKDVELDVRVIAATNRNLEEEVRRGTFREDLFYRLNVISLQVPPLRDRRTDIPEIVQALLPQIGKKVGKDIRQVHPEALQVLTGYNWPGNVRELENVLERAGNLAEGDVIGPEYLPKAIREASAGQVEVASSGQAEVAETLKSALEAAEKQALAAALKASGGNRTRAMRILGVGRTCFYEKLEKYGLK